MNTSIISDKELARQGYLAVIAAMLWTFGWPAVIYLIAIS